MGINIDGARDLVSAGDGSLTIEGFSINSTGIGTFTGGIKIGTAASIFSNGNITAGIVTATNFSVGTAVSIHANGNLGITGIATASQFYSTGESTFIGKVTLQDHLDMQDSDKILLGSGDDLEIYHDGTSNYLHSNNGKIRLQVNASNHVLLEGDDGSYMGIFKKGDAVELYFNNVKEFETKSGGVKLNGHSEQAVNALGNTTGSTTIDFTTANIITATLTGTTTFANPTTESVGQSGSIILTQDGTGGRTAAWGTQFKWVGGTAPTLTTTAAAVDRIDYLVVAADTIHCVASLDVK